MRVLAAGLIDFAVGGSFILGLTLPPLLSAAGATLLLRHTGEAVLILSGRMRT
jgi:hypothetical protein